MTRKLDDIEAQKVLIRSRGIALAFLIGIQVCRGGRCVSPHSPPLAQLQLLLLGGVREKAGPSSPKQDPMQLQALARQRPKWP